MKIHSVECPSRIYPQAIRMMRGVTLALAAGLMLSGCALTSAVTFNGDDRSRKIDGAKLNGREIVEETISLEGPLCDNPGDPPGAEQVQSVTAALPPAAAAGLVIDLAKNAAQNYVKKHNEKFVKQYGARKNFSGAYAADKGICLFILARSLKTAKTDAKPTFASAYLLLISHLGDGHEIRALPLIFDYGAALTKQGKPINVELSLLLHSKDAKLLDDKVSLGAQALGQVPPQAKALLAAFPDSVGESENKQDMAHKLLQKIKAIKTSSSSIVFKGFPAKKPPDCPADAAGAPGAGETPKPPQPCGPQAFSLIAVITEKGTGAPDYDANPDIDAIAKFLKEITK